MKELERGRSMIEILAVLAIIGLLSIGGVVGYGVAATRIRANAIEDLAAKFAAQGVGGRTFSSLKAAGMSSPIEGVDMRLDRAGNVIISGLNSSTRLYSVLKSNLSMHETGEVKDGECPKVACLKVNFINTQRK